MLMTRIIQFSSDWVHAWGAPALHPPAAAAGDVAERTLAVDLGQGVGCVAGAGGGWEAECLGHGCWLCQCSIIEPVQMTAACKGSA